MEPCVLVIGHDPYRVPGPLGPRAGRMGIQLATERLAEDGINVDNCLIGLDGGDDVEAVVTTALSAPREGWPLCQAAGRVSSVVLLELRLVLDLARQLTSLRIALTELRSEAASLRRT